MKKRFLLKLLGVLLGIGILAGLISLPVSADVTYPNQVGVTPFCYRNLLETGDFFILVDYSGMVIGTAFLNWFPGRVGHKSGMVYPYYSGTPGSVGG